MALIDETRTLIQFDRWRQNVTGFQKQLLAGKPAIAVDEGLQQSGPNATCLVLGCHPHFGQFVDAVAMVFQGAGSHNGVAIAGKHDDPARFDNVPLWIAQHLAVDGFDSKPPLEPLLVQAPKVVAEI